ncbi:unnamed protein product [Trichogramma brassicae]|uniref:Uncharacterized protein n=1 Tax=Trichogramma brassicae TaxID=86971 RepID=A0A6H5J7H7_9HYME|nr:unnamed protein product [Trichogramma brassicae]
MDDDIYDIDDSFNQSFYGPQDDDNHETSLDDYSYANESEYYYGEINLAKLKSLREQLNWENEEKRYPFYLRLSKLMRDWKGKLPNLKDIFRREEMDWLLTEAAIDSRNPVSNLRGKLFIEFVFCTGYRDEPELNEDDKPSFHRTTAVHSADTENYEIILLHLFQIYNRFDVNYTDESGFTHFHVACKAACYEIVEEFLELGQDPNCLWTETGDSPLHLALYFKRGYQAGEIMDLLLRHGADPNWANKGGLTPLHVICKNCEDVRLMKTFFEITDENHQTILIDAKDNLDRTPLQLAVASLCPDLVDVLLDRGADLSSFVFPTESYFGQRCELDKREGLPYFYLLLVSGALTVVKNLEKRGYELDRSDALTIMKYFAKLIYGLYRVNWPPSKKLINQKKEEKSIRKISMRVVNFFFLTSRCISHTSELTLLPQLLLLLLLLLPTAGPYLQVTTSRPGTPGERSSSLSLCQNRIQDSDDDGTEYYPPRNNVSLETCQEDEQFNTASDGQNSDTDPEDAEEFGQVNLAKLRSLREQFNWENEEERYPFYLRLSNLMRSWRGNLPNLRDIFRDEEIDYFLLEAAMNRERTRCNYRGSFFIEFVYRTGYRDKPVLSEDGKPSLRRTTALHLVAKQTEHNYDFSHLLFKIYHSYDVNYIDESGYTHFHAACKYGLGDVVKKFLELGQDPNCLVPETGDSPLHLALYRGFFRAKEIIKLLLRSGADPNVANKEGLTPLHVICKKCPDTRLIKEFFENTDANHQTILIDAKDNLGQTPLQLAVASLCPDLVDVLLDRGADLSSFVFPTESYFGEMWERDKCDKTPTSYLYLVSSVLTVVERLEKRGYELDRSDALTIVKFFAKCGFFKTLVDLDECLRGKEKASWDTQILQNKPNHFSLRVSEDEQFNTASDGQNSDTDPEDAEEFGQVNLAKLRSLREQFNWENEEERYPFYLRLSNLMRSWRGYLPNLRDFFRDEEIDYLLMEAVMNRKRTRCNYRGSFFIEFVYRTGYRDKPVLSEDGKPSLRRTTALHLVAKQTEHNYDFSHLLFKIYHSYDVNYIDESGFTHFHAACKYGLGDVVKKFLELGQDPNCLVPETGDSPLRLALYQSFFRAKVLMKLLLSSGADPNVANKEGLTPLHIICKRL